MTMLHLVKEKNYKIICMLSVNRYFRRKNSKTLNTLSVHFAQDFK